MSSRDPQKTKIGRLSAASLIVASMVGAGIFTMPGLIAGLVGTTSGIVLSWLLGGIVAISGALVIAELGAAIPEQGGPYAYFHRIYGERSAFLVGFLTATVGYFAAAAAVALVTGVYFKGIFPDVPSQISATVLLIGLTLVHSSTLRSSTRFNDIACLLKLLLLAVFIVAGALVTGPDHTPIATESTVGFSAGGLASAMVLVFFAYSGWDAAAYVANEIDRPQRNLPWAIILGSGIIVVFYLAINLIYLKAATPSEMAGVHDVGRLAAIRLFGDSVGTLFTGGIILLLISTCSAITFVGPRVVVAMSKRGQTPSLFARLNSRGAPSNALWFQATCMISLVWLVDIDSLFQYVGLLLSGCAVFTIYGAILFRRREPHAPRPFQMPLYPLPALVFMGFSIYTIVWSVQETPWPLVASGATLIAISILRPLLRQSR